MPNLEASEPSVPAKRHSSEGLSLRQTENALGDKAQMWEAGYHNGRAMIECLEILKAMK
ncbi:MAG: hypothetical protein L0387_06975 [Acidobacteria bacterium]|nr:hypothetical protein [Acidobacteriota bacterium]MCI0722714.1 hypothetical protein [Acidobacteriota bacterium]